MADHSKNGSSGTEQAVKMCTCTNMGCPNHPPQPRPGLHAVH